jgi:hypothetical protein
MTTLRKLSWSLLGKGVISAGAYSILTGLAMLAVGFALVSVSRDDPAAGVLGGVFLFAAVWQLQRGIRSEVRRRLPPSDSRS